jgi:hypothetical protein
MKLKRIYDFLNEDNHSEETSIEIDEIENDERNPRRIKNQEYSVSYNKKVDGESIEIEGTLVPYNSGRTVNFKFEPDSFSDDNSEKYYDENWEEIEEEILNKLNGI